MARGKNFLRLLSADPDRNALPVPHKNDEHYSSVMFMKGGGNVSLL